ncbi:MAG: HEPN domain-containing protein [bacterium]
MIEDANILFKKAENDLINAKVLFESDKTTGDGICFHCQQAVEKYLKAYLAYNNKEIIKTHDISNIIDVYLDNKECLPARYNIYIQ